MKIWYEKTMLDYIVDWVSERLSEPTENQQETFDHHNERGKQLGPAKKTEPETDYDEEGMPPHN